jgi:hypothetical protein
MRVLELPISLWVANRLKSPQLAHFRVSNAQTWGMSQTCYAMPVFKLKDMKHEPAMGAGYGLKIHVDESIEWSAPTSTPFEALSAEVKSQKDEIFRLAHQMALGVENNAAAVGRSAESKTQDAQSTRVIMLAFARRVKEAIEGTYDLIERARQDDLKWSVDGLDEFSAADLIGLVESLGNIKKNIGPIPSRTFNVESLQRLADATFPDIDEATKAKIREEIEAGATDPTEDRALELEAAARAFGSPAGAGRPSEDDPGAGAPSGNNRGRPQKGKVNAGQAAAT